MEQWQDHGIVLSVRGHGENGAVVNVLTEHNGRHAGYVQGAKSSKVRGMLETGNLLHLEWMARSSDGLGSYKVEPEHHYSAILMSDPIKILMMNAVASLCNSSLPEREAHPALYHGTAALLDILSSDNDSSIWCVSYIMWEISFMKELGFGLDVTRCAAGGDPNTLCYMSPKSGCAVSAEKGELYKNKLLPLPSFLTSKRGDITSRDIQDGFKMVFYFLEHWVYAQHTRGIPEDRILLQNKISSV